MSCMFTNSSLASKSIPTGTLNGLMFTFIVYALVILSMGATISRTTLYTNVTVIQDVCAFSSGDNKDSY